MPQASNRKLKSLAERFLGDARDGHLSISVYLVNGFQLKGEVVDFDEETVLFNHKDVHQLVMRSAVASMYPLLNSKQEASEWWQAYAPASPVE